MNAETFRKLALEIPGAIEMEHMNHPDFRVGGRIFATLAAPDQAWGMVNLTPEKQAQFLQEAPGIFRPCPGAWGARGATNVRLKAAPADLVREALHEAAQNVLSTQKTKGWRG